MTPEEKQTLRHAALDASAAIRDRLNIGVVRDECWTLQTSNSFRRIGCHGDGDVLCGTKHPSDGHPDLLAAPAVLDYIVAAQPRVMHELLDEITALEAKLDAARALGDRIADVDEKLAATAKGFTALGDTIIQLTRASNEHEIREAANKVALLITQITKVLQEEVS